MLSSLSNPVLPQDQSENVSIRVNQIITHQKQNYIANWNTQTKAQSKMQCYLVLKGPYNVGDYLTTKQRTTLTKYELSEHNLAIETGRYKKPKRSASASCARKTKSRQSYRTKLQPVRTKYFPKLKHKHPEFDHITNINIPILLGENFESCSLAA